MTCMLLTKHLTIGFRRYYTLVSLLIKYILQLGQLVRGQI
jgi:hypothetical protein